MRRFAILILASVVLVGCASSGGTGSKADSSATPEASSPLYPLTLMRQGSVLLQRGRFDEALKRFEKAREIQPQNATVYNMIGLCHLRNGELPQAMQAFDKSLDLVPTFSDALNNRGMTYLEMKQYRMAEVDLLAVLADSTYPHRKEVYYNLGMTELGKGDLNGAEENFRKAAEPPKPVFEALLRLAEVAQRQGKLDEAEAILERARLEFPARVEARLSLGRLLLIQGRRDEAKEQLDAVIEAAPSSDLAESARKLLEAGSGD